METRLLGKSPSFASLLGHMAIPSLHDLISGRIGSSVGASLMP